MILNIAIVVAIVVMIFATLQTIRAMKLRPRRTNWGFRDQVILKESVVGPPKMRNGHYDARQADIEDANPDDLQEFLATDPGAAQVLAVEKKKRGNR